jgi:photosystem II stability/assembly factor-like uncharacterized protein
MHVGQHAVAFAADGKTWVGNDGGAYLTADEGGDWLHRNEGLVLAEFHPGAVLHPTDPTVALAGARGNGSLRYFANTWSMQEPVGDGSSNAIDITAPNSTWYVSHQRLSIFKTVDGGASYTFVTGGITNRFSAAYIAPFAMCPGDSSVLIAGTRSVWRTNDGAGTWVLNSPNPILDGSIQSLTFAPASTCTTYFAIWG